MVSLQPSYSRPISRPFSGKMIFLGKFGLKLTGNLMSKCLTQLLFEGLLDKNIACLAYNIGQNMYFYNDICKHEVAVLVVCVDFPFPAFAFNVASILPTYALAICSIVSCQGSRLFLSQNLNAPHEGILITPRFAPIVSYIMSLFASIHFLRYNISQL